MLALTVVPVVAVVEYCLAQEVLEHPVAVGAAWVVEPVAEDPTLCHTMHPAGLVVQEDQQVPLEVIPTIPTQPTRVAEQEVAAGELRVAQVPAEQEAQVVQPEPEARP